MNREFGPRLRHLLEAKDRELVGNSIGRTSISPEIRLRDIYATCIHGNIVDVRSLLIRNAVAPSGSSLTEIYAQLEADIKFADAANKRARKLMAGISKNLRPA